jgi:cytochrome c biogenesis protein
LTKQPSGVWSFFSSVKLTIVLLTCIAVVSIAGTLVPQREASLAFVQGLPPGLVSFLRTVQVFDLYHSLWFYLLMGLLALNLVVCSLNRFPDAVRRWKKGLAAPGTDLFREMDETFSTETQAGMNALSEAIQKSLRRARWSRLTVRETPGGWILSGEKGRLANYGVYVVHASVLLLVIGAVVGSLFGIDAYVNIHEGDTVNAIELREGKGHRPLPFSVRCDRFTIELYDNGVPKTYQSDLTFSKDGQVISKGPLRVNHPITIEGYRFYQAGYGQAREGRASLVLLKDGQPAAEHPVSVGDVFDLPGGEGKAEVLRVEENLMQMGPAVKLVIRAPQGETVFWVFQQIERIREMNPGILEQVPLFNPGLFKPYVVVLKQMVPSITPVSRFREIPGLPLWEFRACSWSLASSWYFSCHTGRSGSGLRKRGAVAGFVSQGGAPKTRWGWAGKWNVSGKPSGDRRGLRRDGYPHSELGDLPVFRCLCFVPVPYDL